VHINALPKVPEFLLHTGNLTFGSTFRLLTHLILTSGMGMNVVQVVTKAPIVAANIGSNWLGWFQPPRKPRTLSPRLRDPGLFRLGRAYPATDRRKPVMRL
jgi:hypothetical protein